MAGANPNNPNGIEKGFQDALSKFKLRLSAREYTSFKFTTLKDLRQEILRIQAKQALKSECMNLTRVEAFVEGFRQFGEVVEVFLNTSEFVGLVWGPMKFILQVASNYTEAFDTLLSAYEEIAECLPLVEQYRALFSSNGSKAYMDDALAKIYGDILDFHSRALRFFNLPTWRQVFRSVWKDFNSRFGHILRDLRRHKELIESQATALQFQQYQEDRQLSFEKLDLLEKASVPCQRSWQTIHAQTQEQYTAVLQWFCAADSVLDHQDISKTRQEFQGTGTWILKHPKYSVWKTDDVPKVSTLWLNGIPGAGKTVLASTIIEDCREQKAAKTTFFYCKYEDPQRTTFIAVLKAILSQLLRWDDDLLPWCYEKFLTSGQLVLSSENLCKELLHALLLGAPKTFVIIDGLDECNRSDWKPLLNFLAEIVNVCDVQVPGKLRVMIISQNEDNIRNNLRTFSEIALNANDNELDIQKYVQGWCRKIQDKFELEDEDTDYICRSTCYRADGMFLFAKLVMENLHNQICLADLRREIQPDNFPAGLEQAYARIVDRVRHTPNPAEHSLAEKVLGWMTCARRPLKWHEIQAAISTDISDQSVDFAERKSRVHVREICGSLINLISGDRIELVHSTAKYYLVQNGFVKRLRTECFLSALCLQYLTFPCFDLDLSDDTRNEYLRQGYFSFQDYAAAHWSDHVFAMAKAGPDVLRGEASDVEDEVNAAITDFVAYYQLHQHAREEENHIVQWYGRFQGFPFFDDLCHIVRHIQQHQAKGHEWLDEIGPSPLKGAVEASRAILEKLATSNALEANVMHDLVSFYGQNWYKCPKATCFYFHEGFSNDKSRETHIARHERPFRCPFQDCESGYKLGFIRQKELEKHMTVLHPENGKIVPRFFRLKRARDNAEDSESGSTSQSRTKNPATFACDQCTKKFTRNRNLQSHLLAHKAEKPYGCPMCDMRFARNSDRKRHEKLHTGEKKFVCKGRLEDGGKMWSGANWGCGKAFPRAEALNNHFRSEAGKACLKSLLEAYLNEDMLEEHLMHQTEQELSDLSGFSLPRAVIEQYPELERFSSGGSIQMPSVTNEEGEFSESQGKKDGFPWRSVEWSIAEMDNIAPGRESSPTPTQPEREASPMMI